MKISDVTVIEVPDSGGTALVVVVDTDEGISGLGEAGVRSRPEAVSEHANGGVVMAEF